MWIFKCEQKYIKEIYTSKRIESKYNRGLSIYQKRRVSKIYQRIWKMKKLRGVLLIWKKGSVCLNDDGVAKLILKEIEVYLQFDILQREYAEKGIKNALKKIKKECSRQLENEGEHSRIKFWENFIWLHFNMRWFIWLAKIFHQEMRL